MFEGLTKARILEVLAPACALFPPCGDPAWQGLREEDLQEILRLYAEYHAKPYPLRSATGFMEFVRSGSRQADERPYFERRRKLCAAALGFCAGERDALDEVTDGLYVIAEESSWVISAHNINPIPGAKPASSKPLPDPDDMYIDLFSAQTGMIFSLVTSILREPLDEVSPMIWKRAEREIRRRVLASFMEREDFWWMGVKRRDLNNWTPWIVSNVLYCAVTYLQGEELARLIEKALVILDRWLSVVPEDGGCDEGAGYWNMAGGALLDALEILEKATKGRLVFWQDEKLRRMLTFPMKMELGGGYFANFADCDARPFISGERLQYAGARLGDAGLEAMGARLRGTVWDQLKDVPHFGRALQLLFSPRPASVSEAAREDTWLANLQVRIVRRGSLTLCCKGGNNAENHNHNDVGSFILCVSGEPMAVDAGNMVYTAKTFSDDRYSLWNTRSAYHNVPLIGGAEQRAGEAYRAKDVLCLPDGMELDMAPAYGMAGLQRARRSLTLTEKGLDITDDIVLSAPLPVTWVFMLRIRPRIEGNRAYMGRLSLAFPEGLSASCEEIPIQDARMAHSFPGSLFRLLLTAEAGKAFQVRFQFDLEENV